MSRNVDEPESEADATTNGSVQKMSEDIGTLFLNEEFSDVILNIQGEKLYAHKAILAARSDYFKKELFEHFQEAKQSEITVSDVSSIEAFKLLLKYIYTGIVSVKSSNIDLVMEVLILAHKFGINDLETIIKTKLDTAMTLKNVSVVINTAHSYHFDDLKEKCFKFLDNKALKFLKGELFLKLTQDALIELFSRDTFYTPEIEIFKAITKWLENNAHDEDNFRILSCARLGWISSYDIVSVVRPTALIDNEILLNAIAQNNKLQRSFKYLSHNLSRYKIDCVFVGETNVGSLNENAEVLTSNKSEILNDDMKTYQAYESHKIGSKNGIVVKLGVPSVINCLQLLLSNTDLHHVGTTRRQCSYYVEVSLDLTNWKKIIDYSKFVCGGWQNVFFNVETVLYIRVVATFSNMNNEFRLYKLKALYSRSESLKFVGDIVVPHENVVKASVAIITIAGEYRDNLLTQANKSEGGPKIFFHQIHNPDGILIQLIYPCVCVTGLDTYYIETSYNKKDWQMAVDYRNETRRSLQKIVFPERIVVFIKIVGTHSTANDGVFRCYEIQCPSKS